MTTTLLKRHHRSHWWTRRHYTISDAAAVVATVAIAGYTMAEHVAAVEIAAVAEVVRNARKSLSHQH